MTATRRNWDQLRARLEGDLVRPGDAAYERARRPTLPRYADTRPQAVVRAMGESDVAATLDFAGRVGLSVTPRSGGHCFAGRSSVGAIIVDVDPMAAIHFRDDVVEVGAGVRLAGLSSALAAHSVAVPTGCGVTVGIAGLAMGGGMGTLGRRYGLTCDQLVAARVVLADGTVLDCDDQQDTDLFWALRGAGGGQFGIVTRMRFRTVPEPTTTAFHLAWSGDQAAAVLGAWLEWAPDAPDEVVAELALIAAPAASNGVAVQVFGVVLAGSEEAARQLDDLIGVAGTPPSRRREWTGAHGQAKRVLAALRSDQPDPGSPEPVELSKSEYFRASLPTEGIDHLIEGLAAPCGSDAIARHVTFTPWGGAYGRTAPEATAFAHREARYLVEHVVEVAPTADADDLGEARSWLAGSWQGLRRWGTGGVYPNFPDPDLDEPLRAYHGRNLDRLRRVKRAYDPEGRFWFPQAVRAEPA